MAVADKTTVRKDYSLNPKKLRLAQKALATSTDTETIERALDLAILEHKRNQIVTKAHRDFVKSGIVIRDVFGRLTDTD